MNTLPPNQPLDEEERELARILRALPGGEPPAALDAAILRAATNAAAASQRPVRRALASAGALWGIGSAAAAVLALGVAWQLRYGVNDASITAERAPHANLVADDAEDDSVQVDIPAQAENAPMAPPPPALANEKAAAAPAASGLRREVAAQPARAAPAAAAELEAFANDRLEERQAASGAINPAEVQSSEAIAALSSEQMKEKLRDQEMADAAAADKARAESGFELKGQAAKTAQAYANAASPPPPPAAYRPAAVGGGFVAAQSPAKPAAAAQAAAAPAPAPAQSRADSSEDLDKVGVVGGADHKDEAAPAKKPATWLADIRKLRDQGKIDEARAALVEFRKKYPKWVIPTDLAPLLKE
jgi:hypothetical protein